MNTSTYNAQCETFKIAQQLANNMNNVSSFDGAFKPPFCLRVVKKYRTQAMQDFRDAVAKIARTL